MYALIRSYQFVGSESSDIYLCCLSFSGFQYLLFLCCSEIGGQRSHCKVLRFLKNSGEESLSSYSGYSQCEIFIFSSIRGISFSSYCLMQLIVVPENRLHLYFKKRQVGDDDKAEEQPFNLTLMIMKQDAEYMWFRLEDLLIKCGMLNLVDLAGFENISRSGAGEAMTEKI
ncbi:uncharacterized protein LOC113289542 isoform X2 [Papaver somniferum]|uniref:uncharacterized protein LOC113289542 isoform X2 n=1 Tax=Papaver somniferum TaxID=3469 RepID=UPI000E6F4844|nr:uncharacterized protein LOC113289542 isoform X2 [Papaver somniferum]